MKQLYYTSCEAGKSVGGQSGFNVRAVSPGLTPEQQLAARRLANYELPDGLADGTDPAQAPTRLAWLDVTGTGRMLIHTVYVGADPTTGRTGNYFCHALMDLPAMLDVRKAILTWGSNFWHRHDEDGPTTLDPVTDERHLGIGDGLVVATRLSNLLASPKGRELFTFALQAFLTGSPGQRLFLVARAEEVALCVYGLARALPNVLRDKITFSTYEKVPLQSEAGIVGTWWTPTTQKDLPSTCYEGSSVGLNTLSGRKSVQAAPGEYARFAVDSLANRSYAELDKFVTWCDGLTLVNAQQVDELYRLRNNRPVTRDELLNALNVSELVPVLAARADLPKQVIEWALDERDGEYRKKNFGRFVDALRTVPQSKTALEKVAEEETKAALNGGRAPERARLALGTVLPAVSTERAEAVWKWIASSLDPTPLPWALRAYLSERLLSKPADRGAAAGSLDRWTDPGIKHLAAFLALGIAPDWKIRACIRSLETDPSMASVAPLLAGQSDVFFQILDALAPLSGNAKEAELSRAANLFVAVARVPGNDLITALQSRPKRVSAQDPLLRKIDPGKVPPELRFALTKKLLKDKPSSNGGDDVRTVWAKVPIDQLAELLAEQAIHAEWKERACSRCLGDVKTVPPAVAEALAHDPDLLFRVLANLTRDSEPRRSSEAERRVAELFVRAAQAARAGRGPDLIHELLSRPGFSNRVIDSCLSLALNKGESDAERLLKTQGNALLARLPRPPEGKVLVLVAEELLGRKLDKLSSDPVALGFLQQFHSENLSDALSSNEAKQCLATLIGLNDFLGLPAADCTHKQHLADVANVLRDLPARERDSSRQKVIHAVAESLLKAPSKEVRTRLKDTLALLGPAVAKSPSDLYEQLVDLLLHKRRWLFVKAYRGRLMNNTELIYALIVEGYKLEDTNDDTRAVGDLVREVRQIHPEMFQQIEVRIKTLQDKNLTRDLNSSAGKKPPATGLGKLLDKLRDTWFLYVLVALIATLCFKAADVVLGWLRSSH